MRSGNVGLFKTLKSAMLFKFMASSTGMTSSSFSDSVQDTRIKVIDMSVYVNFPH